MRIAAIIISIGALCMTTICTAQQATDLPQQVQFIQITHPILWDDGMACKVGEIEAVLEFTPTTYVIWNDNGKRYEVNRTQAKKITTDEAAIALLVKRQELYASRKQIAGALALALNDQRDQGTNQHQNELQEMRDTIALLRQLQDLVNGGRTSNTLPLRAPAGKMVSGNHWIKSIIERGKTVQLEDGSLWELNPLNKVDTVLWLATERITIIESGDASYPYELINTDGKSTAEAKLISR